ncbi:hypothetical protein PCASD_06707 [Puccinia coronata f. sp. avenae]|uniref:Uncharacterized protein n=1 Tax=Puccinia coronata f. sp. avenae TaxID=200324 RepID=A0A2N5TF33_9BASI|nr:hypothetical protein PCASD_06707 [Puccinia coronata f. sp. avenae]
MENTNQSQICRLQAGSSRSQSDSAPKKLLIKWNATFANTSSGGRPVRGFRNQAGPPQPRQIQSILSLNTQTPTQPNIRMTKPISVPQIILTDAEGFQLRIDKESKAEQQSTTLRLRSTPAGPSQFADAPSPEPPAPMNPNKTKEQAENREEIQELNTKYLQVPTLKYIRGRARRPTRSTESRGTRSIGKRPERSPLGERRSTRAGRPQEKPYTRPDATRVQNA